MTISKPFALRPTIIVCVCAALGGLCGSPKASAQEERLVDALDRLPSPPQLTAVVPRADARALENRVNVLEFIKSFRTYQSDIGRTRGTVSFGTTGDTTATQDQFKANAGIELEVGTYPSQLRVTTKADVRTGNNELREDVSTFVLNFDHYFVRAIENPTGGRASAARVACDVRLNDVMPSDAATNASVTSTSNTSEGCVRRQLESYAFIERFSDSFLTIDRRFEVGAGIKLEWHSGRLTSEGRDALGKLSRLKDQREKAKSAFDSLSGGQNSFDELFPTSILNTAETFARNRFSSWEVGLAFSVFRESERPGEFTTTILDAGGVVVPDEGGSASRMLRPGVTSGERFTVRPSLIWRPRREFALTWRYYYKMALGNDDHVDDVRDVRRDISLAAEWKPGEIVTGRRAPTIALVFERHEDAIPPNLAEFASLLPEGGSFTRFSADREHRQVRLEARVDF